MSVPVTPTRTPGALTLDAERRGVLEERLRRAVRRARRDGEALAALTIALDRRADPSAIAVASRRPGEPWWCFEQPDRDGAALATLGVVRTIEATGRDRFADAAQAWRRLAAT